MGSVYWFHSPPCICDCLVLCLLICQVGSWWTFCQVCSALCVINLCQSFSYGGIVYYKNGQKIILKIRFDRAMFEGTEWWAGKTFCGRISSWGMEHILDNLFDN